MAVGDQGYRVSSKSNVPLDVKIKGTCVNSMERCEHDDLPRCYFMMLEKHIRPGGNDVDDL